MKIWGRANSINVHEGAVGGRRVRPEYERTDVGGAFGGNDQKWYLDNEPQRRRADHRRWRPRDLGEQLGGRDPSAKYAAGTMWPNDPGQRERRRPLDGLAAQHDLRASCASASGA